MPHPYLPLMARRDSYLPGVQCLVRSLRAGGACHPLLVLYTPDTLSAGAAAALQAEGCAMTAVQRYAPPGALRMGLAVMPAVWCCCLPKQESGQAGR